MHCRKMLKKDVVRIIHVGSSFVIGEKQKKIAISEDVIEISPHGVIILHISIPI